MPRLPTMARRLLLSLGFAMVLVLVFSGGSVIIKQFSSTSGSADQQTTTPARPESHPPSPSPSPSANWPASVTIWRYNIGERWQQIADIPPAQLPPPSGPPTDSRHGAYDCAPSYRAVRAAGSRDALTTNISVNIEPKSFQEVTITSLRVRAMPLQSVSAKPRYLYLCQKPNQLPSYSYPETIYSQAAESAPNGVSASKSVPSPAAISANRGERWSAELELMATDKAYAWQIELSYTSRGKAYHEVLTKDIDGVPLVTESAGSTENFADQYAWCANTNPPSFRPRGLNSPCAGR
jgi:hypothetical protein